MATMPLVAFFVAAVIGYAIVIQKLKSAFSFTSANELIIKITSELGTDITSDKIFSSFEFWGFIALLVLGVMLFAYASFVFLIFSHRIAGPIFKFGKAIQELANGDLTARAELRAKDEFQQTAAAFNTAVAHIRERIRDIDNANEALTESLRIMKKNSSEANAPHFDDLIVKSQEIEKCISEFEFKPERES